MLCRTTKLARITVPATFVGFKRNKHNQHMQQSLLKIKCAEDKKGSFLLPWKEGSRHNY
eukprot:gnl/Chilomastix_caulleri/4395.p2 GENE.gnl/Chilomastix_caulleri/4395~~gnl/Chilomastix_caulleri/4395.p2  ORF type:complete len:59 (+),score=7.97 gnl/Chilomastix_caulleri/4395:73-249(+)